MNVFEHLKKGGRLNVGNRTIRPVGKVRCLGTKGCGPVKNAGLGKLKWDAPLRSATVIIGQKRGEEAQNKTGACAAAPTQFSAKTVDRWFARIRAGQIGKKHFGASAQEGRGWYEGEEEPSIAYQIIHDPHVPEEETFSAFREHMQELAEELAEVFCQDSVLVVMDTEKGKHTYAFEYDPAEDAGSVRTVARERTKKKAAKKTKRKKRKRG